jgi:glycine cleavage system H lipoate-binding protein
MRTLLDFITLTKGIEYLIAVAFLTSFVLFWHLAVTPARPARSRVKERIGELARNLGEMVGGFLVPEKVYFHPGHAWTKVEWGDLLSLGIDDFGQKLLGPINAIQTPEVGSRVKQGERAWTLQVNGQSIDMLSPVDGEIIAVNEDVLQSPEEINKDPFGKGWVMAVRNPDKLLNLKELLSGIQARKWIEEARTRLMAITNQNLGTVLADAGPLRDGIARTLDSERWVEIVRSHFLTAKE